MANFNITISNSLNFFGPAPSNKWNQYNWNSFLWGEGTTDLAVSAVKVITNDLAPTDAVAKSAHRVFAEELFATADMGSETLRDGEGYYYNFPDRTTEAEDRDFPDWSQQSASSTSWASQAAASTSWS